MDGECNHSIGSLMDGTPSQSKDRQWRRNVVLPRIKPRASGLSRRHSATEPRHPLTATPPSFPIYCSALEWLLRNVLEDCCVQLLIIMDGERNHSMGRSPAVPPFFLSLCHFKGLQTVTAPIVFHYTLTIGLWTVGESRPSDSPCCYYAHYPLWSTIAHSNHPIHSLL